MTLQVIQINVLANPTTAILVPPKVLELMNKLDSELFLSEVSPGLDDNGDAVPISWKNRMST